MGSGKPRGIRAGRKLTTKRRLQKYINSNIGGLIRSTTLDSSALASKTPSWAAVWPRDSLLKKSVYNQNNLTQPSERVSESCSRKTVKKLLLSFHGTVASTI